MIYTTKKCYYLGLNAGKISLLNCIPEFSNYVDSLFGLSFQNDLTQFKGLEKIEGPLKICKK